VGFDPDRDLPALMREVLRAGSEQRLAHLTLLDDPFARRLQPGAHLGAVDFALAVGRTAAEIASERWGRRPEEIAAALGVPICRSDDPAQAGRSVLFSEYGNRPPSITLHVRSIDEANQSIEAYRLGELIGVTDVGPLHLTHELYHHLEGQKLTPGTAHFRIETWRLGPFHLQTGLPSLSEIAADRFAQGLLGLEVAPKAIEFITLFRLDPDYAWRQVERLRALPVSSFRT
jgi:hypothetical protein